MPTTRRAVRPTRSRALRAAAALAATTALAAACADEAGEAEGSDGGTGAPAGDLGTIEGALATLPAWDGDDLVTVTYGDAVVAAELAGVDAPDDPADAGALVPWVNAMTGIAVRDGTTATAALLLPERIGRERMSDHGEFADELGFSLLDVERFVERDTPPERVTVFEGDIGEDDLDEAMGGADDGVWLVGDPEGGLRVDEVSPARPLGESLWLTLGDGQLTIAGTEDAMDDVRSGFDGASLADDTALADLAGALDRHDAYSAMLVAGDGLGGLDPSVILGERATPEQAEALLEEFEPCTGVTGVAAGIADDGEPLMLMVITSASDDDATANAALVEAALTEGANPRNQRPWSEIIEIESVETEGATTTITARPAEDVPLVAWSQPIFDRSFPPC